MHAQRTVALYGVSVFMAAIEAALNTTPGFQVVRLNASLADAERRLGCIRPDIVIADVTDAHTDISLSFLMRHPHLPVIGLDLASNKVVVLSCEHPSMTTLDELIGIIHARVPALDE